MLKWKWKRSINKTCVCVSLYSFCKKSFPVLFISFTPSMKTYERDSCIPRFLWLTGVRKSKRKFSAKVEIYSRLRPLVGSFIDSCKLLMKRSCFNHNLMLFSHLLPSFVFRTLMPLYDQDSGLLVVAGMVRSIINGSCSEITEESIETWKWASKMYLSLTGRHGCWLFRSVKHRAVPLSR